MATEHPNPYHDEVPDNVEDAIGGSLMDPDSSDEGLDTTAEAVAEVGEDEYALTAEEAAMHVVSEDAADDLDPALERAEYLEK